MIRRIAFAVGDTAGHVMPALAIAEAYNALLAGAVDVRLFAAPGGPAPRLAAAAGLQVQIVSASPLARAGPLARIGALARVVQGIPAARRLLGKTGTRLVIGTGGYASGAVLLAARSLGLATAIVEPNVTPGLANRLLRPWVDRAYVSEASARFFTPAKALIAGTPVSPALGRRFSTVRVAPPTDGPIHVLVTGASRGEHFLGAEIPALLGGVRRLGVALQVWHQSGSIDVATLEREYERHSVRATVVNFIDNMPDAYQWAHFVVGRAGAGTLAELAVAGLPALIVPLADAAADHQASNAAAHAQGGAAIWLREQAWDRDAVARQVAEVLLSRDRWMAMSSAARQVARPDAAAVIVDDCERLMEGRW